MRHTSLNRMLLSGSVAMALICATPAGATIEDDVAAMKQAMAEQSNLIKQQRSMIENQASELQQQRAKLDSIQPQFVRQDETAAPAPQKKSKARKRSKSDLNTQLDKPVPVMPPATAPVQTSRTAGQITPEGDVVRPEINVLPDAGGVLTPRGVAMFEASIDYTNSTRNVFTFNGVQVADVVLVGVVNATSSRRQVVQNSARLRLGLTNRMEMDVRVPYLYRNDALTNTGSGTTDRTVIEGHGLGDIDVGVSYQLNRGRNNWPFFVANARYKHDNADGPFDVPYSSTNVIQRLPAGTGFKSIDASVTAIKLSDPAVFFANLGYVFNLGEDVGRNFGTTRITHVNPGDAVNASLGLGFSINPEASFTLGYKHSHVFSTEQDSLNTGTGVTSKTITDTQEVGAFTTGLSYRISESTSLNFNVEVGATSDAPDVRVGVRVPIRLGKLF